MHWHADVTRALDAMWRRTASLAGIVSGRGAASVSSGDVATDDAEARACPECLYVLGVIPATHEVRLRDDLEIDSYSCKTCGRTIDARRR